MAATVSGLDVTLVTVVQDFSQLAARWGPRAATIVNNHSARVVLAGLCRPVRDAPTCPSWSRRVKDGPARRRASTMGTAQVVAGARPVTVVGCGRGGSTPAAQGVERPHSVRFSNGVARHAAQTILAVDIGATKIKYCRVDSDGELLETPSKAHPVPVHPRAPRRVLSDR